MPHSTCRVFIRFGIVRSCAVVIVVTGVVVGGVIVGYDYDTCGCCCAAVVVGCFGAVM